MIKQAVLIFWGLFIVIMPGISQGQNADYNVATGLLQQQNYEEALPILEKLSRDNPEAFVFFEKYMETLIQLKEFDRAENAALQQLESGVHQQRTSILLAEVYHLQGNHDMALETWTKVIDHNNDSIQTYYTVANSMSERREYEAAIELYQDAQQHFNNSTLFMNELAGAYMQAGKFEEAVGIYIELIIESPDQMSFVQQHFLRMRDDELFEIAAFEIEDKLLELEYSHRAYPQIYQLLAWLLIETGEYDRAFIMAQQYEEQTPHTVYSLFSLGNQFSSASEFEFAANSYKYYVDNSSDGSRFRAMEELGTTYVKWADHLKQNNLEAPRKQTELLEEAYDVYTHLIEETPGYERADRVYTSLIDLSLDHFKNLDEAEKWLGQMRDKDSLGNVGFLNYAEGRIALFKKDFTTARQALTRADKTTDSSNLSEKSRYFLSLSDFFAGDFEFAGIQLRSLERRATSYYANDAIKLHMWIRNGQRADTTGSVLRTLGEGMHGIHSGAYEMAFQTLEPIMAKAAHPFADHLTLEFATILPQRYTSFILSLIERQLNENPYSALRERLLWNRAILAEQFITNGALDTTVSPENIYPFLDDPDSLSYNESDLNDLYEEVIIEFPNGFYAPYAREKLQSLQLTMHLP